MRERAPATDYSVSTSSKIQRPPGRGAVAPALLKHIAVYYRWKTWDIGYDAVAMSEMVGEVDHGATAARTIFTPNGVFPQNMVKDRNLNRLFLIFEKKARV